MLEDAYSSCRCSLFSAALRLALAPVFIVLEAEQPLINRNRYGPQGKGLATCYAGTGIYRSCIGIDRDLPWALPGLASTLQLPFQVLFQKAIDVASHGNLLQAFTERL